MILTQFFFYCSINKDIIKVYNDKNMKFFRKNLNDIILKNNWYIFLTKKYYLILKVVILDLKRNFSCDFFEYFYLIINIDKIELNKLFNLL